MTRHVDAVVDFPNPEGESETERLTREFYANPKALLKEPIIGNPDTIVSGITDRIISFAGDRIIDIGATLILMLLGVAITTVGVLRIFAATAETDTGKAAIGVAATLASAKTGGKF